MNELQKLKNAAHNGFHKGASALEWRTALAVHVNINKSGNETYEQCYSRLLKFDPDAQALAAVLDEAQKEEAAELMAKEYGQRAEKQAEPPPERPRSPSEKALEELAAEYAKANGVSYAQAYAAVSDTRPGRRLLEAAVRGA